MRFAFAPAIARSVGSRIHEMVADWPVLRVAEIRGAPCSFWFDCACLRRIFWLRYMLPRTVFPIATPGRAPSFHEIPLSEAHLVSGSVVRLTAFPRAGCASSGVGALLPVLTSSVTLGEPGSAFSDLR